MNQKFSLVDRHTSSGVEGTNKQLLRHLRALVHDERVGNKWSDPTILPLILYLVNSSHSSETGVTPMQAKFGSIDMTYHQLPEDTPSSEVTHDYIKLLDTNLKLLTTISKKYQAQLAAERTANNPTEQQQNMYMPGDFVLMQYDHTKPLPNKLFPSFSGPYQVVSQYKNDVMCKDLIHGSIEPLDVARLKPFIGTYRQAHDMAKLDQDQFDVDRISTHRGDPWRRTFMDFEVIFADGTVVWLPWTYDLSATMQFEEYVHSKPALFPLIYTANEATKEKSRINKLEITSVAPGDSVLVDLQYYGVDWYAELGLPDADHLTYVVIYRYTSWVNPRSKTKINAICDVFDEVHTGLTHCFVKQYGNLKQQPAQFGQPLVLPANVVLIDREFVLAYPQVLEENKRERLLRLYRRI